MVTRGYVMKTKSEKLTEHYFRELQKVWLPWKVHAKSDDLLVPLCTPLRQSSDVLVIGAGHSRFDGEDRSSPLTDVVAERFSKNPPDENTFVVHGHDFASAIRESHHVGCARTNIIRIYFEGVLTTSTQSEGIKHIVKLIHIIRA